MRWRIKSRRMCGRCGKQFKPTAKPWAFFNLFDDSHGQTLATPVHCLIVGIEKDIDVIAFDRTAAIDDFDGFIAVTGDDYFGSEWQN